MSVIFGVCEGEKVILCGDKRLSSVSGEVLSDDATKIIVVNNHLAVASAGNVAIEKIVEIESSKLPKEGQTVESILSILQEFYQKVDDLNLEDIKKLKYCALIAGRNTEGNAMLISLSYIRGKLSSGKVTLGYYGPPDIAYEAGAELFVKNYRLHRSDFCARTVKEVSQLSKYVSPSGVIWTYDNHSQVGTTNEF